MRRPHVSEQLRWRLLDSGNRVSTGGRFYIYLGSRLWFLNDRLPLDIPPFHRYALGPFETVKRTQRTAEGALLADQVRAGIA